MSIYQHFIDDAVAARIHRYELLLSVREGSVCPIGVAVGPTFARISFCCGNEYVHTVQFPLEVYYKSWKCLGQGVYAVVEVMNPIRLEARIYYGKRRLRRNQPTWVCVLDFWKHYTTRNVGATCWQYSPQ